MDMSFSLLVAFWIFSCSRGVANEGCDSPQYLSIGEKGVLTCSFHNKFHGILWYNSTDTESTEPILEVFENLKAGKGYLTGEYDILPNGSLIIKEVSPMHDSVYTVVKVSSRTEDPEQFSIVVITTVYPNVGQPVVDNCDVGVLCYRKLDSNSYLNCFVRDTRPIFEIKWTIRTFHGDKNVSTQFNATGNDLTHTLLASTQDAFYYTSMLSLLVCKAESPHGLLQRTESTVLTENNILDTSSAPTLTKYVALGEKFELKCHKEEPFFLIWKRKVSNEKLYTNILYSTSLEEKSTNVNIGTYKLGKAGSLLADEALVQHEGLYCCLYGNGITDGLTVYDVVIYVNPTHPIVEGCSSQTKSCVIEVEEEEGNLTCSLLNVRPKVQIEWVTAYDSSSEAIDFTNAKSNVHEDDGTFNVSLTSKYRLLSGFKGRLIIECRITGKHADHFNSRQQVMLSKKSRTTEESEEPNKNKMYWLLLIAPVAVITIGCGNVLLKRFRDRRKRSSSAFQRSEKTSMKTNCTTTDGDNVYAGNFTPKNTLNNSRQQEEIPMLSSYMDSFKENQSPTGTPTRSPQQVESPVSGSRTIGLDAKDELITQLEEKYKDLYSAIRPLPYDHDQFWSVEKVFVDGMIEFRSMSSPKLHWEKLESRLHILSESRMKKTEEKTTRRILEGDPGYGKSILFLQLAYDWVNKVEGSSLNGVEILILLRLKQVRGKKSFFKAIKQCILPQDCRLTEEDIEHIIYNSSSVLILLDGFNEYADREADNETDISRIITKSIFQQYQVILSTRTSCLPRRFAARTERLRLTGFNEKAQEEYISKIFLHSGAKNITSAKKLKNKFMKNPVFRDLCKSPLFFVALAHISHDSKLFKSFRSVSSFFTYLIWCFHSHLKTNIEFIENIKNYPSDENNKQLNCLAFDGLNKKKEVMVWQEQEICDFLGQEAYDHHIQVGILVAEKSLSFSYRANAWHLEGIEERKEVRFFHDIACEWYAAHYLAEHALEDEDGNLCVSENVFNNNDETPSYEDTPIEKGDYSLCRIDPSNYQYVFRFACGMNTTAAQIIIRYLKSKQQFEKLAILCIYEDDGKLKAMINHVKKLCASPIHIRHHDSLVSQRSTIEILETAYENKIPISSLKIFNSFKSADFSANILHLRSNLRLPILPTLQILWLDEGGREMSREETQDLLQCLLLYVDLKSLRLSGCLLPMSFDNDVLLPLKGSNKKRHPTSVMWDPRYSASWYYLNFGSGQWERGGEVMTETDYGNEQLIFQGRNAIKRARSNSTDLL